MTGVPDDVTLEEDLLWRAFVDWVPDYEVLSVARRKVVDDFEGQRDLSVGLIARRLFQGYLVAGRIGVEGFEQWEGSTSDAVERIAKNWAQRSNSLDAMGDVVWLCATPAGEAIGEAVCRREGRC